MTEAQYETVETDEDGEPIPGPEPEDDDDMEGFVADTRPEPEPEPETPHRGPLSEDEQAQVFDKAIKRAKTYMAAVPVILGESARELILCPRCTDLLPGFILPLHVKAVPPDQLVAVKQSIGELVEPEYRHGRDTETCGGCNGLGKVDTGSQVTMQKVLRCEDCQGKGWIGPRAARVAQVPAPVAMGNGYEPESSPVEQPLVDSWGRTADHPGFWVMPHEGMPAEQAPAGWTGSVS